MSHPEISDALKAWIGRQVIYESPEEIGLAGIRYFALATGDDNPLYHDAAYARESRHGGIIAPPTLIVETNQFVRRPPGPDGYAGHAWELPLQDTVFMRGGNDYELFQPVVPGDRITATWTILDIYARETRQLGTRIFVVSEARYVNQQGELLAVNRETSVYRDDAPADPVL